VFDVHVLFGDFFDGDDVSGVDVDGLMDGGVGSGTDV
jgi:hypothetical protein